MPRSAAIPGHESGVFSSQLVEAHGRPGQVAHQLVPGGPVKSEQLHQRAGLPGGVGTRVEQGSLPAPPLGETHDLAIPLQHLSRTSTGKTDQAPVPAGLGPAPVHRQVADAERAQRSGPPGTDPGSGIRHIGIPQRVVARDPDIDPEVVARSEQHRSPTAAPPDHLCARRLRPPRADDVRWLLSAPEHDSRSRERSGHGVAALQPPELLYIEGVWIERAWNGRGAGRGQRAQGQEAAARYGSHRGSTSERCRSRHR